VKNLWRISNHANLEGLSGEKSDGRWHTSARGKRIVYLAEHPAVSLIEVLAHLKADPNLLPGTYQLLEVEVEDDIYSRACMVVDDTGRRPSVDMPISRSQSEGEAWLKEGKTALLIVPSFPSPFSLNFLFNPRHQDARGVRIAAVHTIAYDKRLFKVSNSRGLGKGPVAVYD